MCRKLALLALVPCVVLSLMASHAWAAPDPVGWWYLDDGTGTTAEDSSGNGLTGTINNAVWVSPGSFDRGAALEFSREGNVDLGNSDLLNFGTNDWTITAWINTTITGTGDNRGTIFANGGDDGGGVRFTLCVGERVDGMVTLTADDDSTKVQVDNTTAINNGEWRFIVGQREATTIRIYADGVMEGENTVPANYDLSGTSQHNAYIGAITSHASNTLIKTYAGLIDDVRVFDQALTEEELAEVMTGFGPTTTLATNLRPTSGATDVVRDGVVLTWDPAESAKSHHVYFGMSFDEVDAADLSSPLLISQNQDANSLALDRLDFGTTYYWRVDEVNGAPDYGVNKGEVSYFEVEPVSIRVDVNHVTASSASPLSPPEMTVNGSGLDGMTHSTVPEEMWLSAAADFAPWLMFEFDRAQKLDQMLIWNANSTSEGFVGWGIKDVNIETSIDGVEWTALADAPQIARAPGIATYDTPQGIDLGLVLAKYVKINILNNWGGLLPQFSVAEVQFFAIPTVARTPIPGSGTQGVDPRTGLLFWRAGREAGQHDVFVGADPNALGAAQTVSMNSLALKALDLALDTTYYWQVDEVNETQVPSQWTGDLWNFTTLSSFVVDDFESYNNLSPDRPFQSWIDGYGFTNPEPGNPGNNSGSGVGHDIWSPGSPNFNGSIMETVSTVPGSTQSMPVYYDNSGANGKLAYSQVDYAVGGQDWTAYGLQTLSIAFRGQAGNTGQLYAKINTTKIPYDLAATDIAWPVWQVWNIDLTQVNGNLGNVQTLSIGVDGAGASGMILIDDIRLYAGTGELITPTEPGSAGLLTSLAFDEGAGTVAGDSSGNGHDMDLVGSPVWTSGKSGSALQFGGGNHGLDDDAEDYLNGLEALTISLWVKSGVTDTDQGILIAGDPANADNTITLRYDAAGSSFGGTNVIKAAVTTDDAEQQLESSGNLQTTEWQHLCMTWESGGLLRLYVDGVEDTPTGRSNPNNAGPVSTCDKLLLGKGGKDNTDTTGWDGLIDEVTIYDRVLSAEEILWLAGRTTPIHKPL